MEKTVVAIAGTGIVGKAVKNWFDINDYPVIKYDRSKNARNLPIILERAEVLFICVSTPYNNGYDGSSVVDVLERVKNASQLKTIVIKSTVLPGTTEILQQKYKKFDFVFNPEFLTEKNAKKDYLRCNRQIIGCTQGRFDAGKLAEKLLPKAEHTIYMSSTEAEIVKYAGNSFLAMKVVWANMIYDVCNIMGANYDDVIGAVTKDERIGESHTKIAPDGNRGYGGMCFPKDVRSLRDFCDQIGLPLASDFFDVIDQINTEIR